MKLTINTIPISIKEKNNVSTPSPETLTISQFIDSESLSEKTRVYCTNEVELLHVFQKCIDYGHLDYMREVEKVVVESSHIKKLKRFVEDDVKFMRAAGGLVFHEGKILTIFRYDHWDLPKGKIEPGELQDQAALREVEEECGVQAELAELFDITWHSFPRKGKTVIKETIWYAMNLIDDSNMQPQEEEEIEQVVWKNKKEVLEAMDHTFPNIKLLFEQALDRLS